MVGHHVSFSEDQLVGPTPSSPLDICSPEFSALSLLLSSLIVTPTPPCDSLASIRHRLSHVLANHTVAILPCVPATAYGCASTRAGSQQADQCHVVPRSGNLGDIGPRRGSTAEELRLRKLVKNDACNAKATLLVLNENMVAMTAR
ncbi:hypothetical protein E2542_SST07117 [Spatholobus suberectus]|nr:hypothetical protein E2542_SST07117 [Spatholobus suberectus]